MSERPNILVVDDSDFDRATLARVLETKGGFGVLEAGSGAAATELLDKEPIALVLLDLLMPGEGGEEVLGRIRKRSNPVELPVIMVTARSDDADVIRCLKGGANDYVTKPVNFEVALSRIQAHLKLAELTEEMLRLREFATLDSLIATYNHEINNPLAIAVGCLSGDIFQEPEVRERLSKAIWRIADIVKKIRNIAEKREVEYARYGNKGRIIKLK